MLSKIAAVALAATLVSAQTHTLCDPTKKDCPNPPALGAKGVNHDFRTGKSDFIHDLAGTYTSYDKDQGALYEIKEEGNAPTTQSGPYIFFGQLDVEVRVAPGAGIVTSVVLQSDDLDEIDWEWVGSDHKQVQTNYFSKGCVTSYDRGGYAAVSDAQERFHIYTIKWTPTQLDWIIDGVVVRTLKNEGLSGCAGYPQSPMQVKLGSWIAGNPKASPGTIEWAGGLADMKKGPFVAAYRSINVTDFMGGQGAKDATEYVYTDRSGTWQSIKVVNDGKTQSGGNSSGNSTTTKPTGAKTTLTTLVPTNPPTADTTDAPSSGATGGAGAGSGTTTGAGSVPTGAAGKVSLNLLAMGAAAFLGYLVL
ncbi:concanavalin A-like lectin/glucanase domain-containing protein [Schizothecium vesticola]|uniref:Crh-like protein n=1 Tax=Schizothecium vesticola TaxID=314040 RepID=A0AA40EPL5_9PEZI|nr:concanavalin A-like lectin/glucanase domain-containing protein [Schizothecium vesticola]